MSVTTFGPRVLGRREDMQLTMQSLFLTGQILPVGARLWVRHEFQSNELQPVEVVYAFSLPREATLRRFRISGEGFDVASDLRSKEEARKEYQDGIAQGLLSTLASIYRDGLANLSCHKYLEQLRLQAGFGGFECAKHALCRCERRNFSTERHVMSQTWHTTEGAHDAQRLCDLSFPIAHFASRAAEYYVRLAMNHDERSRLASASSKGSRRRPVNAVRLWIAIFSILLLSANLSAQLRQIDPAKLPDDQQIHLSLSNVKPIEYMAHSWSSTWSYDTPKAQVASLLASSLRDVRSAKASAPQNEELLLLTGIVAHLAYNVDVEDTYEVAIESFENAHKVAPADYRPEWFLAYHRCQSNELQTGMEEMLAVERQRPWRELPIDFWDDYINCSTMSLMPAHTLRAIDHAVQLGENPASYTSVAEMAHNRYKPTAANTTYPAHDGWRATSVEGEVHFASELCGLGFSAHGDWHMDIRDVGNGVCVSMVETGPYASKSGQSTPTILILSRPAKPDEQLDDFVRSFLKKYPSARPFTVPSCPSDKCVAFEIITDTTYESEGGGHFLVVGFAEQPPDFPGLLFESPEAPPKVDSGNKITYSRPNQKLHRLPGTLYTVVELDSNGSIFEKAADDFRYVLRSIQLD